MGDTVQLESVIQNLLVNSKDAFIENNIVGKYININVKSQDDSIVIIYNDTAGGMPPEVVEQIFEPFFTTKAIGLGTGLGMSIAKDIMNSHKGDLQINTIVGKGSTFTLTLPNITPAQKEVDSIAPTESGVSSLPTLLIVDDEPSITEILSAFFEDEFDITATNSSAEALVLVKDNKYSAILTDMRMPKFSGVQVTEAAVKHQKETPVILVTGQPSTDPQVKLAIEKGACKVINKPFENPTEILNQILKILK
jgi:CheY-like chemotaxis protein